MFRTAFVLAMLIAVTVVAQEAPDVAETEAAQVQKETVEQQVEEKAADDAPEFFDPTEEVSEDHSIDFPVDI